MCYNVLLLLKLRHNTWANISAQKHMDPKKGSLCVTDSGEQIVNQAKAKKNYTAGMRFLVVALCMDMLWVFIWSLNQKIWIPETG